MSQQTFLATIRGIADNPTVIEINVRSGPSTTFDMILKAPVGLTNLTVLAASADSEGKDFQGKVYQWLHVSFPDGQTGWVRDDLIEIEGDGTRFGYGTVYARTFAFLLHRVEVVAVPMPVPVAEAVTSTISGPTVIPMSAPAPTPAPVSVPVPADVPSAIPATLTAYINMRDGANARSGPGTTFNQILKAPHNTAFTVTEARQENGGQFRWASGNISGQDVWIREDLLRYEGDLESLGLGSNDSYPAPLQNRWWVRGFTGPEGHWGWDFGAQTGEPIYCGPNGGLVTHSVECSKCTGGRSFKSYGLQLSDNQALNDPSWNFGYGHYVIVRYLNEQLPDSTRQWLAANNLAGAHIFAMYAHLDSRRANVGQVLTAETVIGTCGDTGNSEATHLHLEIRAATNPNETNWAAMKRNLFDPTILFGR